MISRINSIRINPVSFSSKRKNNKKDNKTNNKARNSSYNNKVNNLVATYNIMHQSAPNINLNARYNFKKYQIEFNNLYGRAADMSRRGIAPKNSRENFTRRQKDYFIEYNQKGRPLYAGVKDNFNENELIFDFSSKIALKNYQNATNNSLNSAEEVYVFNEDNKGNIYSNIANAIGHKIALYNVVEESKDKVRADSLVIFDENKNGLFAKETYINPRIYFMPTLKATVIRADSYSENYSNIAISNFVKNSSIIYVNKEKHESDFNEGWIHPLSCSKDESLGIYSIPEDRTIARSIINLFKGKIVNLDTKE